MYRPKLTEAGAKAMSEFFSRYGGFIAAWNSFELMIEIMIMRELKISHTQCSIVCGSLQFQSKANILFALLNERSESRGLSLVKEAVASAERNALTHSALTRGHDGTELSLVRRAVRESYRVDVRAVDRDWMESHVDEFLNKIEAISQYFSLPESKIDEYVSHIESRAKSQQR